MLTRMCGDCHEPYEILKKRRTGHEWREVLDKMIEKGAAGNDKDFEQLLAYLRRVRGEIYINFAPPDEIIVMLGLSKKDADAIVTHRDTHGAFADFDALKKVPGIDHKTVDTHKDAIVF